ncbi:MAG: hypothetical protein CMB68_02005 [Euryarchaeota archaeon]|nr:hypothetical protein [Euryarchaeota archaeon]|tara:strand:+ start:10391 stop:10579 length:189 start_codon:yes stop_codon:yes gene_type:complete
MASKWPFTKKPAETREVVEVDKRKIVEYERKPDEESKEKMADRSHLENKSFKDAMDLLGGDS